MTVPRVLNGRYEMGAMLGRGGMADVHMARDTLLGRTVAIKLLRSDTARDAQQQARFRREAQAVAGLNHPAIVAVYDTGEHLSDDPLRDGATLPYIVMEYVHGKTLRELIKARSLGIGQSVELILGVLSALEYSHRAGIIHRDIKPANVMVVEDEDGSLGAVKVMDFGIARTISDSAATMTATQTVMGTAQYLSPEQARGESVDARSDLYSTACLLYEMVAGRPPFTGESPVSVAYQHVRETPPAPSTFNPEVSGALDAVLLHALHKDRADRFQDAASFRRALDAARRGVMPDFAAGGTAATDALTALAPLAAVAAPHLPEPAVALLDDTVMDDDGPSTRAMAKVLAGGALTTSDDGAVEEPPDTPRSLKRRRRAWTVTLFVFLAIILGSGGAVAWNLYNHRPPAVVEVGVPDLARSSEVDAMAQLSALGLEPRHADEHSASITAGEVIRTDPPAGTQVPEHSAVDVFVSTGPSEVQIPTDLGGKTEAEVRAELTALNLSFNPNDFVDSGNIAANLVVTTDPAPGKTVPVGTQITLKISNGEVLMPSLFDLSKDPKAVKKAVQDALTKASPFLSVTFVEEVNAAVTPGMVTKQSEPAGTSVPQRTVVVVTLAKAPEKPGAPSTASPPEGTPSPTATDSPPPADGN